MENNSSMSYNDLYELASERIINYVDRLSTLEGGEDYITQGILLSEIRSLSDALDNDDEILAMTYHRHLSESFGMVFESEHGDPELMFGHTLY